MFVLFWFCFALLFCLVELRLFLGLDFCGLIHDLDIFGTCYCLLLLRAILPARGLGFEGSVLLLALLCLPSLLIILLFGEH